MELLNVISGTVGSTAEKFSVNCRKIIIQNPDDTKVFYFKIHDGVECTSSNGFAIYPKETLDECIECDALSIIGSAAGTPYRILVVN